MSERINNNDRREKCELSIERMEKETEERQQLEAREKAELELKKALENKESADKEAKEMIDEEAEEARKITERELKSAKLAESRKQKESKPKESKQKESKPKESKPKESKPKESKPKESKPKESKPTQKKQTTPKESKPKETTNPKETTKPKETTIPKETTKPKETIPEPTRKENTESLGMNLQKQTSESLMHLKTEIQDGFESVTEKATKIIEEAVLPISASHENIKRTPEVKHLDDPAVVEKEPVHTFGEALENVVTNISEALSGIFSFGQSPDTNEVPYVDETSGLTKNQKEPVQGRQEEQPTPVSPRI